MQCPSLLPVSSSSSSSTKSDNKIPDLACVLRTIYTQFLADLNLTQPMERFESDKLMKAVLEYAERTGVPCPPNSHSYSALMVGYSYADNCTPYHPLEVKVYIAIYTWLAVLCDDAERVGNVLDIERFQERWMAGEKQPSVLLQAFADQLRLAYKYFHPLASNLIITSTFNFMTSTALVGRDGIKRKLWDEPSPGGQSFAWYIRERDSVGEAYGWFTFPKDKYPDLDVPIEAIDDMTRYFSFVNDVLSFYKEELAGEKDNYIHGTAAHKKFGKDSFSAVTEALRDTARDAIACQRRIEQILAGKGEYEKAWALHASGYIGMHVMRSRYRLWELGLGEKPQSKEANSYDAVKCL